MESSLHSNPNCGNPPDRRSGFGSRLVSESSPHDEFAKTRGGRRAIQKPLNGSKLSARQLASMGKIQGTLCISRSSIWSKAGRCSHVRKLGPLSRSVDCFFVRPTRRDVGSLQPYVGCTTAYALMMSGTRHPRSRYEELWVRVMDVSKYSARMTQSQETA
jgi:hypothetical protein